ncbi:1920_t:CDS:1, partial [Dentiscutata heterogama]
RDDTTNTARLIIVKLKKAFALDLQVIQDHVIVSALNQFDDFYKS